jgi:hypothetical protein
MKPNIHVNPTVSALCAPAAGYVARSPRRGTPTATSYNNSSNGPKGAFDGKR